MADGNKREPEFEATKSFGDSLDSLFGIGNGKGATEPPAEEGPLDVRSQKLEEKKRVVDSQAAELAAIENRLKEAEARLAQASKDGKVPPPITKAMSSQTSSNSSATPGMNNDKPPIPAKDTTTRSNLPAQYHQPAPEASTSHSATRKPGYPRQDSLGIPPVPGALPATPGENGAKEYMEHHEQGR